MTSTAILGWNNYVKTATITAGSAATSMPATNVAGDQGSPSAGWQTVSGVVTAAGGAVLTITPPTTGQAFRVLGVFGTNLTAAATVTFKLFTNPSTLVTSVALAGPVSGYGQVVCILSADTVADYATISFDDSTNPESFINVPLVFTGPAWFPLGSTGFNSTVGRDESVAEVITRGGQEYPTLLWQRRRWNITLDSLRQSETWLDADPLFRQAKQGSNVFFAPNPASAYLQQEAIFGRLKGTSDISFPYQAADRRQWQASITERL